MQTVIGQCLSDDWDLLFVHVQTSVGLLFSFMTISAGSPWLRGPWPHILIPSSVLKYQTEAESSLDHSQTPKCCHSPVPDHLGLLAQDMNADLVSNHKTSEKRL